MCDTGLVFRICKELLQVHGKIIKTFFLKKIDKIIEQILPKRRQVNAQYTYKQVLTILTILVDREVHLETTTSSPCTQVRVAETTKC